jgi:hypothetical protein
MKWVGYVARTEQMKNASKSAIEKSENKMTTTWEIYIHIYRKYNITGDHKRVR